MIPDGATIMYGGFLGCGSAHHIIEALAQKGTKDLTIIGNDCGMATGPNGDLYGMAKLVHNHQVKRVIATGGQTVDIDYESNSVYVDGVLLDEPYIREPMDDITADPNRAQTHFEVPEGEIFVMGDNRNNSDDSRDIRIGSIDEDYILGKAVFSLLPFDTIGPL